MVYCPKCGIANSDDSVNCINCGEVLKEETRFLKILDIIGYIIGFLAFIIVIYIVLGYFKIIPSSLFPGFLLVIALFIIMLIIQRVTPSIIIKLFFGGLKTKECPECEELVSDDNYCFNCGYQISNVKGYFKLGYNQPTYIEVNKNYIREFKTLRTNEEITRTTPNKYLRDNIKNPRIEWQSGILFSNPVLKFDYSGRQVELKINSKILEALQQTMNNITGTREIGGFSNWIRNQKLKRWGIIAGVILALIIAATYYFTYTTDLTYAGSDSNVPGVEVVNASGVKHLYAPNSVSIEGYVKNSGNITYDFLRVNITGYDSEGNIISKDDTFIDDDSLGPGETSYFLWFLDDYNQQIRSFKIEVEE